MLGVGERYGLSNISRSLGGTVWIEVVRGSWAHDYEVGLIDNEVQNPEESKELEESHV
jgi:hypothetical protein